MNRTICFEVSNDFHWTAAPIGFSTVSCEWRSGRWMECAALWKRPQQWTAFEPLLFCKKPKWNFLVSTPSARIDQAEKNKRSEFIKQIIKKKRCKIKFQFFLRNRIFRWIGSEKICRSIVSFLWCRNCATFFSVTISFFLYGIVVLLLFACYPLLPSKKLPNSK